MKDTLRLFVAFPVIIESALVSALKRTRISAQKKEMEVNWSPESNFHVTLNFLGETSKDRLTALEQILSDVAKSSPTISTSLKGMGAFPDPHHMRVLWIGVRKTRALAHLQDQLKEALSAGGFEQEDRDYIPHLTIGRLRKARSGSDLISPYVRTSFGEVAINSISLFESALHSGHPVYKIVNDFKLTGIASPIESEIEPDPSPEQS